jgi:hypothetical protein
MTAPPSSATLPDIVADEPAPPLSASGAVSAPGGEAAFDGSSTVHFQAKMSRAPAWFCSFVASNHREKRRFRDELVHIKGAWPLLMKQRNGGTWTPEDKQRLKAMVRSASTVSPYLFIWAIPGSMVLLPFLAWFLDRQRKKRAASLPS